MSRYILLFGLLAGAGFASANLVANGGFENTPPAPLTVNATSGVVSYGINGWRIFNTADNDMVFEVVSDAGLASEGTRYLLVSSLASAAGQDGGVDIDWRASGPGVIDLEAGVMYTFSFDLRNVPRTADNNVVTFVLRNIQRAGTAVLDTFVNSVLLHPPSNDWSHYTYTFVPTSDGVLYAGFRPKTGASIVTEKFMLDGVKLVEHPRAATVQVGLSQGTVSLSSTDLTQTASHCLQTTSNLAAPSWHNVSSPVSGVTSTNWTTTPSGNTAFYRIVSGEKQAPPNILMILTDDQGFPDVGIHGHPVLSTPNMDRIANAGVRFDQFQACAECAPTRAGIMTGRNPFNVGVTCTFLGKYYLQEDQKTLADLMGEAGYQTAIVGKWHLGEHLPSRPQDKGFEYSFIHQGGALGPFQNVPWDQSYFDAEFLRNGAPVKSEGFATDVEIDEAISWLQQRDTDRPFFLYLPTSAPHGPYTPPQEDKQRFLDMGFGQAASGFYGLIENLDQNLGRLLDYLDSTGLSRDTLICFMGDNGTSVSHMSHADDAQPLWNAGLKGGKSWGDEGGTRVPCFMSWPGKIKPGRISSELAAYIDFLPTFLDVAGAVELIPADTEGVSLVSHLLDAQQALLDRMICNIGHLYLPPTRDLDGIDYLNRVSVRSTNYRMFRKNSLYAVQEDPGETVNLALERPDILQAMADAATRFWQDGQAAALAPVHIHLGSPKEPVVMLTSVDWRPLNAGKAEAEVGKIAFWMGQGISKEIIAWQNNGTWPTHLESVKDRLNGFWNVYFTQSGTYEFRATLTPPDVREQVHLKEGVVWLVVNGEAVCEASITSGAHEAVLQWTVEEPFRGEIQVLWSEQLPFDAELGAFVCDVERVQ